MLRWIAFKDQEPPTDPVQHSPKTLLTRRLLVTNNRSVKSSTGQPSHVWFLQPLHTNNHEKR